MTAANGNKAAGDSYDARSLQEKWQERWAKENPFEASEDPADERPHSYVLDMFPYPSGDLHMGHAEAFAMGDVVARYRFQRGENVLHPIGWDSFGLPAENAAIKNGTHPAEWTYANIEKQAESFRQYGVSFDWTRRLHTSDPEYYQWNQWFFLRFYERNLAYRKEGLVNWCPQDQTVLANEQVIQGRCERCHSEVVRRSLNQWYFRITDYADRLLDDMSQLEEGWPERVLTMQRNWIGRSYGADIDFTVEGRDEPVTVYTTRPDTLYGSTFFVVAADAALADELCSPEQRAEFETYREQAAKLTDIQRQSTERTKTGVFLGRYAINPASQERIPVLAADYVLAEYGHGAIMAVPAHDQRDLDFAFQLGLPVREVLDTGEGNPAETGVATTGEGTMVNSGPLDGLAKDDAIQRMVGILEEQGTGRGAVNYRLRDWLLSRQRFWGTPIPIIHCPDCGEVPVPDEELPVKLPDNLRGSDLDPKGISPLAVATDWVNVTCPQCHGAAQRDTDTMDTFVDSSWYPLRYCSPNLDTAPFDPEKVARWGPVDQYVGGVEHATLHLLYARFFTKVLHDMGMVGFVEPFTRLLNQGQVINGGRAMSKSLGNGVDLGEEIDNYGVDAVRLTMVFASPPEDDVDWADVSPAASLRFLNRALRVMTEAGSASAPGTDPTGGDIELRRTTHQIIDKVTSSVEMQRFNVAVARVMELVTASRKAIDTGCGAADPAVREAAEVIAVTLSLVAPYVSEEGWERLGHTGSVVIGNWRSADPELLVQESVTCVVQVANKVRDKLEVAPDVSEEELERRALASQKVQSFVGDREIHKIVVRPPKLVNIVVG